MPTFNLKISPKGENMKIITRLPWHTTDHLLGISSMPCEIYSQKRPHFRLGL
jgi:hypothetical protein